MDLSDFSTHYFGVISFMLRDPYPQRVVEVIMTGEEVDSVFDDWIIYMDGPLILDVVYDDTM